MPLEHTSPPSDEAYAAWQRFRAACFIRLGPYLVWHWSAAHEFDLSAAGLLLSQLPGARFEYGTQALAFIVPHAGDAELNEWHVVPLVRMTRASLDVIQPAADLDLARRRDELTSEQQAAQEALDFHVKQKHLWRMLPGSADGTLQ